MDAGSTAGYWRATEECRGAVEVGPDRRQATAPPLGRLDRGSIIAAAPAHGGGFLVVHRNTYEGDVYAYDTVIRRGEPDSGSGWQRLAEFRSDTPRESHVGPSSLIATDTGYLATGRRDDTLLAWTSADAVAWEPVPLPAAGLGEYPRVSALAAGPDGTVVAVGTGGTSGFSDRAAGWVSTDSGTSWDQSTMPGAGEQPRFNTLVHDGNQFVALGAQAGTIRSAALVMTSPDGIEWTRDDTLAEAGGASVRTATVLPGGDLLAAAHPVTQPPEQDAECGLAWRRTGTGWVEEPLGCHGVPSSLAVLEDGSVAGASGQALFLRVPTPPATP